MGDTLKMKKALSATLYKLRISKNYNRTYLATKLGVSKSAIDKMEQGVNHLRFCDVYRLCKALEVSTAEFMDEFEQQLSPPAVSTAL